MGRPLYSRTFKSKSTPAVRDPEPLSCETWSYLNAFDPDSDEFFDNENAVYEDFIGPVTPLDADVEVEDEEDREILVVRMGNISPITSESSLSDSDSPLAAGADDPAHLVVDAFHDIRHIEEADSEPAVRVRLATRTPLDEAARWGPQTTDSGRSHPRRGFMTTPAIRSVSYHPYPQRDESLPVPAPSTPIPVPAVARRSSVADERPLSSPSTPPHQTPLVHFPMSPPPASTPRIYSWARNPSHSTSPSPGGPFTNPRARTSYAHLSPAFTRMRDVTV